MSRNLEWLSGVAVEIRRRKIPKNRACMMEVTPARVESLIRELQRAKRLSTPPRRDSSV